MIREGQEAARVKGVHLHIVKAGTESEIDAAFATLDQLHVDAANPRPRDHALTGMPLASRVRRRWSCCLIILLGGRRQGRTFMRAPLNEPARILSDGRATRRSRGNDRLRYVGSRNLPADQKS